MRPMQVLRHLAVASLTGFLLAGIISCQGQEPDALRRQRIALEEKLAEARGQTADRERQITELRARLTRTESELDEANRRLVRVKVDNAKLRQELSARQRKNGR